MEGWKHTLRVVAVCLSVLLLIGGIVHVGSGPSTARAQEVAGGPAAATPVAVPPEPTAKPTATLEPTPEEPVVTLVVESMGAAFGVVAGTGELDPAVVGVTNSVDETGAFYVKAGAIHVIVTSDGPWIGTCHARENSGSAPTIRVADGRLEWRLAGAEAWNPFGTNPADPAAAACFPDRSVGVTSYTYDVRLRVERSDPPGTFATAITFAVAPERAE